MTSTQNIAIPSGRPHVELKPSFTTTPAPTPEEESAEFLTGIVEAMAENNTGLLDSGSALSSSLGHELHVHTGRTSGGKTTFVNTKPYVPADFTVRRQGLGERLAMAYIEKYRDRVTHFQAEPINNTSRRLLRKLGFTEQGNGQWILTSRPRA